LIKAPLFDAIEKYAASRPVPFHMPGHKMGKGLPEAFCSGMAKYDVTEIPGTDNLHFPEDAILMAQDMAAEAFGADKTFFLVNGSTCGVLAAMRTVCRPGDRLIIGRDCHRSVYNGISMWGIDPVFINPAYNPEFGISSITEPSVVEKALTDYPDAKGVLITSPNYYGICSDISKISKLVHDYGKILIVDEAHGAHLRFNRKLPLCSMDQGADISIQSAHKTLPALTPGAFIHTKSKSVDIDKLQRNLRMLQTTSPSYLVMCSLDIARAIMQEKGESLLDDLLDSIYNFRKQIAGINCISVLTGDSLQKGSHDPTRIVIGMGCKRGFETEKLLREKFNIQVEMSDMNNIVCIATVSDNNEDLSKLACGIRQVAESFQAEESLRFKVPSRIPDTPERAIGMREAEDLPQRKVPIRNANGCIASDYLTPYPPGIPVIIPGEVYTDEIIGYVLGIVDAGGKVNGIYGKQLVNVVG
jgi:lysine decarboxylase